MGTQVQTIIFPKDGWTADKVRAWLRDRDFKTDLDTTDDSYRARQRDPGVFDADSFRTITLTGGGETLKQLNIRESLVPFKARVLAAVPGKSLNKRIYTKELLQQCAPFYEGRPFIMDHDIEHGERTIGIFGNPRYAVERGMDNRPHEGLWLDAVGRMDTDFFEKVKGDGLVPPLVRGFSIGGTGEGEFQDDGILIKNFVPVEGSITAFPGIPLAHIAAIDMIREHFRGIDIRKKLLELARMDPDVYQVLRKAGLYKNHEHQEVKKTNIPVKETIVSLEEAEKQAAAVREGPVPDQDGGAGTRQRNDVRPGLPTPGRGKPVLHQQPQATTSADTGLNVDGGTNAAANPPMASTGSTGPSTSKEAGPAGTSPDADKMAPTSVRRLEPGRQAPAQGNKSATRQLSGTVTAPGQKSDLAPVTVTVSPAAEADNPMQDHPGQTCPDAHPDQSHDDFMADDEDEERMTSKSTTVSTTTSRTDSELIIEPDEERRLQIRQDDEPTGVTKDKQPMAHPGEEEKDDENPILKTAGQSQEAGAEEETVTAPDTIPIQARAYSLPVDTGIYQAALRLDKMRNADRTKEAQEYIAAWNEAKKPPEQPLRRVRVKTGKVSESVMTPGTRSMIATIQPTVSPRDNSVPTKSITSTAPAPIPMQAASAVSTFTATAEQLLEKVRKEPFGHYNLAGRAWRKMLPELLEIR